MNDKVGVFYIKNIFNITLAVAFNEQYVVSLTNPTSHFLNITIGDFKSKGQQSQSAKQFSEIEIFIHFNVFSNILQIMVSKHSSISPLDGEYIYSKYIYNNYCTTVYEHDRRTTQ